LFSLLQVLAVGARSFSDYQVFRLGLLRKHNLNVRQRYGS